MRTDLIAAPHHRTWSAMHMSCRGISLSLALLTALAGLIGTAHAKPPTRNELLLLLKRRPATMTVDTWREQRREAARELGRLRERRAVPVLLQIIESERFDVILEIAIDALGNIGDRRAVPPLRRLLNDPSLDGYVRDAVAGALRKLGAAQSNVVHPPTPPPDQPPAKPLRPEEGSPPDQGTPAEVHPLPRSTSSRPDGFAKLPPASTRLSYLLADQTLARSEKLDLVAGTGQFRWEGGSETTTSNLDLQAHYLRQVERPTIGYSIDGTAGVGFGMTDPAGDDNTSWEMSHSLRIDPEVRYYPFLKDLPLLFGQCIGGVRYGLNLASPANALENRLSFSTVLSIGGGPGYGRVVDVGPTLRLQRIERVLRQAGLLDQKLDRATSDRLVLIWYSLRNTIGGYAKLGYTLRILRDTSALSGPVDPATSYQLIQILEDPQLLDRRSGLMFRLGYGYAREIVVDADDREFAFVYGSAETHLQRGTVRALEGAFRFMWNHISDPGTFSLNVEGTYNWYLYNRVFDPLGQIGLTASAGISNQPGSSFDNSGIGYELLAGASYTRHFASASRIVASVRGGADRRGGLVMVSVEARYGVAQGAFVRASGQN